jgi:uncharacterized protein (UPF0333 family)
MILFIIILLIIFAIFFLSTSSNNENFLTCDRIPSGPYKTKCTDIKFNSNILYALCPTQEPENIFIPTKLNLDLCVKDNNDCESININSKGELICE